MSTISRHETKKAENERAVSQLWLKSYGVPELEEEGFTADFRGIWKEGTRVWANIYGHIRRKAIPAVREAVLEALKGGK